MNNLHFKVVKTYDEPFDCEDCGTCYPEGLYVQYNGVVVWEKYSDGHYSGNQTEDTILNTILAKYVSDCNEELDLQLSEEKRHEWNKNHQGNAIARTPESWREYHESNRAYITDTEESIKEDCQNLPYDEVLQVKMIALWIESATGQAVSIEVTEEKYSEKEY